MNLYQRLKEVKSTNPYFEKDLKKAFKSNKFIGRGSALSSTNKYLVAASDLGNCGKYESTDVVFISTEGNRKNRIPFHKEEIDKAIEAKVMFITDDMYNRNRSYNIGEREVANHLKNNGYVEKNGNGEWIFNS